MSKVFGIELVSVSACAQVSALADGAVDAAVEFIAGKLGTAPTLEAWDAIRVEWRGAYMVQRDLDATDKKTAGALDTAWHRNVVSVLAANYELVKPKASTKAATEKAAQRAKPEAVEAAQTVADLAAIPMPSDAVEAAKLLKAVSDKRLQLVKAEARAEEKTKSDAIKAKRDALREWIKTCDIETLTLVESVHDGRFEFTCQHIPMEVMQAAIATGTKALGKAPKARKVAPVEPALV